MRKAVTLATILALAFWPIEVFAQSTQLFFIWDGKHWAAAPGILTGDVTGQINASIVSKLQGVPISSTSPTPGQALIYNGTQWSPVTLSQNAPVSVGVITLTANGTLTSATHSFPAQATAPVCVLTPQFDPATLPGPTWWSPPATVSSLSVNLSTPPASGTYSWSYYCGAAVN